MQMNRASTGRVANPIRSLANSISLRREYVMVYRMNAYFYLIQGMERLGEGDI